MPGLAQVRGELAFLLIDHIVSIALGGVHADAADTERVPAGGVRPGVVATSCEATDLIPGELNRDSGLCTTTVHGLKVPRLAGEVRGIDRVFLSPVEGKNCLSPGVGEMETLAFNPVCSDALQGAVIALLLLTDADRHEAGARRGADLPEPKISR